MLRLFQKLLVFIVLIVIQLNFIPLIQIYKIIPDLLLVVLFIWCCNQTRISCVLIGFFGGLLQDFTGAGLLGVYSLSKSIACYFYPTLLGSSRDLGFFTQLFSVFICTLIHSVITLIFTSYSSSAGFFYLFLRYGLPSSFYTLGIWVVIYFFRYLKDHHGIKDLLLL